MSPEDVESIEQATLAAVPPLAMESLPGWLLPLDPGPIGRARSAVPLAHQAPAPGIADLVEAAYRAHGLPAAFRLPALPAFDALRAGLAVRGYAARQPTRVLWMATEALAATPPDPRVRLAASADEAWASLFLGEGFDPVEGAGRVAVLRRGRDSVFATRVVDGQPVAAGALARHGRWAGIHGMRTALAQRGRGHATAVMRALAAAARTEGCDRVFLQVEADNGPALSLYRRLGFQPAWDYDHWRR